MRALCYLGNSSEVRPARLTRVQQKIAITMSGPENQAIVAIALHGEYDIARREELAEALRPALEANEALIDFGRSYLR